MGEPSVVEMLTVEAGSTGTRLRVSLVGDGEVLASTELSSAVHGGSRVVDVPSGSRGAPQLSGLRMIAHRGAEGGDGARLAVVRWA